MPKDNLLVSNFYRAKKLVSKLGMESKKLDYFINGCMLYYKDELMKKECRFCYAPRYKVGKGGNEVPLKRMQYLPLTPRLKRLYASTSSATLTIQHFTQWHFSQPSTGQNPPWLALSKTPISSSNIN